MDPDHELHQKVLFLAGSLPKKQMEKDILLNNIVTVSTRVAKKPEFSRPDPTRIFEFFRVF